MIAHRPAVRQLWPTVFFLIEFVWEENIRELKVQFSKAYSINTNKISKEFSTTDAASVDDCAKACLNSSKLFSNSFECLSFDICMNSDNTVQLCSFYNSSHIEQLTDEIDIVVQDTCDHYSSMVDMRSFYHIWRTRVIYSGFVFIKKIPTVPM